MFQNFQALGFKEIVIIHSIHVYINSIQYRVSSIQLLGNVYFLELFCNLIFKHFLI